MARSKYSERYCGHCNKSTRMELVGEMASAQDKVWYRCARCHHMSLMINDLKLNGVAVDLATATPYNPERIFNIGDSIFHSEWNDFGKVMSKTRTSSGSHAIVVSFEKQGQRTLVENLKT